MADLIGMLIFAGVCYYAVMSIYQSGKATGSRKGYSVGRKHAGRRK